MAIVKKANGSLALFIGVAIALCVGASGCDDSENRASETGSVTMALDVAPGTTLDAIAYAVTGPGSFTKSGAIDVSQSSTISTVIGPLPPGTGFSILLSATSTDGNAMCLGSANFDVTTHSTTSVLVHLLCRRPTHNGSAYLTGFLNVCPLIDSLGASPGEVLIGGTIALASQAHDTDMGPSALGYQWSASGGTISDAVAQNPQFTCTSVGPATITLTVSDGDNATGCPDTQAITVVCTAGGTGG